MRFVEFVPVDGKGKIIGHGDCGDEHLEEAARRGKNLIVLKPGDPYVFDGLCVDLQTLRLIEDNT